MTRTYRLVAPFAVLVLMASANGATAQTNCTNGSLKTASDCFNKLLDQANDDMQAKYNDAETTLKHANGQQSQFDAQLAKSQDTWLAYRTQTCASDLQNMFQGLWGLQQ